MRPIADTLQTWLAEGEQVVLAIVVDVEGSVPRPLGTTMAIAADGRIAGNVSAGCVDGAVVEQARQVLAGGPPRVATFGISDEQALTVGLTCGGGLGVLLTPAGERNADAVAAVLDAVRRDQAVAVGAVTSAPSDVGALVTVTHEATAGDLGDETLQNAVARDARELLWRGAGGRHGYPLHDGNAQDEVEVTILPLAPPPRMLIFGGTDIAAALCDMGQFLGYRVTVCDARSTFATKERFPSADEVAVQWPHRYLAATQVTASTVICVLTHDPKFDVPLLQAALGTPSRYIGLLGSRRTQEDRRRRLRDLGVSAADLERLHAPIGLDLGARTPPETAVSIAAEIIASQQGGTGQPLRMTAGAIHREHAKV